MFTLCQLKRVRHAFSRRQSFALATIPFLSVSLISSLPLLAQETESNAGRVSVELVSQDTPQNTYRPRVYFDIDQPVTIEYVQSLVDLGTIELAWFVITEARSQFEQTDDWLVWENLYFELGWRLGKWDVLIERADEIANSSIYGTFLEVQFYAARAEVELKQYDKALLRLRRMLLQVFNNQDLLVEIRKLIVRVYFEQQNISDAQLALAVFDRDYRLSGPEWEHRYIRVLLRSGNFEEAMKRLAPLQTLERRLLDLYARYRTRTIGAAKIVSEGLSIDDQFVDEPRLRAELWALIESAASDYKDIELQISTTESALSLDYEAVSPWEQLLVVPLLTVDRLIDNYERFALQIGNEFGLIIGDDLGWFQVAQEFEITSPITARAFHAYLARNAAEPEYRKLSTSAFARSLFDVELFWLLNTLFVDLKLFELDAVPVDIQTRLHNFAIRNGDYVDALAILEAMSRPEETDQLPKWLLRHAGVAIAVAEYEQSEMLLDEVIDLLSPESEQFEIDRVAHAIFDLQSVDKHAVAIRLLKKMYQRTTNTQARRELLRWIADSWSSLKHHQKAARYAIQSASLGSDWSDEWALANRLMAADELVKAEMIEDAIKIYSDLREDILDPRKRALVINRLNELSDAGQVQ